MLGRRRPGGERSRLAVLARTSLVGALVAALAVAGAASVAAAVASGSAGLPRPAQADAAEAPSGGDLLLAADTAVATADTGEVRVRVLLRNPGEIPLPGGQLHLTVDPTPVTDPAELAPGAIPGGLRELVRVDVTPTGPNAERELEVTVPLAAFRFSPDAPGVYALRADLRLAATEPLETRQAPVLTAPPTPLVWQGVADAARVPLALVIPLGLPDSVVTMPSTAQLRDASPRLLALIDTAERTQATLAVDPRIVAAIRLLGDTAPAPAQAVLERLTATTTPVFALQFADADPAAQAALGRTELLQPLGFEYLRAATGEETDGESTDTEPAPAPAPDDGTIDDGSASPENGDAGGRDESGRPSDASATDPDALAGANALTRVPQAFPAAWPAEGAVDRATLGLLAASGMRTVVLDSTNVAGTSDARARIDAFTALVADHDLGRAGERALTAPTATERASGRAHAVATLALAAQQGRNGMLLAVDRAAAAEADDTADLLAALTALPWVRPVAVESLPLGQATLREGETREPRRESLRLAESRSASIDDLAPLLEQPSWLIEFQRVRLLTAFATRLADPDAFTPFEERYRNTDDTLLGGVHPVTAETTQLVGVSSELPVTLHNALPFDARVTLRVTPTSAAVAVPTRTITDLRVRAEGNQTALVTVRSRVSSGESGLVLGVWDADGKREYRSTTAALTIRSSLETLLLLGLGSAASVLLAVGIARSVRRRAARRREPRTAPIAGE